MKRVLGLWLAGVAAMGGCNGYEPSVETLRLAEPSSLEKVGMQVYWEATARDLGIAPGEHLRSFWRIQENVYCLTTTNRLIALDADLGVAKWAVQVADPGSRVFRPVHTANVSVAELVPGALDVLNPGASKAARLPIFDAVVINSSDQVLVIDRKTGKVARRINLDNSCSCAGATDGSLFYGGTAQGRFFAASLDQALTVWTSSRRDSIDQPIEYYSGAVYVASEDGTIVTARAGRTAETLTVKTLGGPARAPFHVDSKGCFVPAADNQVWAFTSDLTGKLWDRPFSCKGPVRRAVQVGEKTVFQRAEDDKLYAINLVDGQPRWALEEGVRVLAAVGTDVYVLGSGNRLLQVDEVLGTTKGAGSLGGLTLFADNAIDPVIYAATVSGRVVCIKPITAGQMSPATLKKAAK